MSAVATQPVTVRSSGAARSAALGVAAICTLFGGLQIGLAAGAPLGEHVWRGSQPRVLLGGMRVVSVGAAVVLAGMATVVLRRAGLIGRSARWLTPATRTTVGYFALNTVGNVASSSNVERYVFGPGYRGRGRADCHRGSPVERKNPASTGRGVGMITFGHRPGQVLALGARVAGARP